MSMFSSLYIEGFLGKDPKETKNGGLVFSIGHTTFKEQTIWIDVVFQSSKKAETALKHLRKGSGVKVVGQFGMSVPTDPQYSPTPTCFATDWSFLGGGKKKDGEEKPKARIDFTADDIPF